MPAYEILAPASVFRTLDDLTDADYDLVSDAILGLADDPLPPHAMKLRMKNANIRLTDGTAVGGPFLRIRVRSVATGKSGGFRVIYIVDTKANRVCLAKVARRDDDTYKGLQRLLQSVRMLPLGPRSGERT